MGRRARPRAIVYARGDGDQVAQQIIECDELCRRRGYEQRGVCRDGPGETAGWEAAQRMREPGDRIIVASTVVLPDYLESATGALPGPQEQKRPAPPRRALPPTQRRPRPAR